MSVRIFYAMNGYSFDYDRTVKDILKALATDETGVEADSVTAYFRTHTAPLAPEYEATIDLWLSRIDGSDRQSGPRPHETTDDEPNDCDRDARSEE
ncbi:hypothetical protein [Halovivax cerinus]|uniref:Uncharacterized protein n=1 Tax=Halovivax cerinus TaxID=1487865 RepID=A0ABD5NPX8_9EURY|nr:hypothetical protein [Halovivax cerinus]